jgi:hypothetical protein
MMVKDIVPDLLTKIQTEFEEARLDSEVLKSLLSKLQSKSAGYLDANEYAIELGEILSKVLRGSVSPSNLPDGKMYYNIAKRLLTETLGRNFELISGYAQQVQKNLNEEAKIGLRVQVPELNQDRIAGLVNRISSEAEFSQIAWILKEPIVNFSQSIIDDSIQKNAEFQKKVGLAPIIERHSTGHCCDWCQSLVGKYLYGEEPLGFYRRHQHCQCTIDYHPKNGKQQNSWSKKWSKESADVLERRKQQNIDVRDNNRKVDIREYKKIVEILGPQNAPISLAQFQELKYNDSERYERLRDVVYIQEKFKNGTWLDKINPEKQARHIQSTSLPGKSYFYDHVDVNTLYDKYKMTGFLETSRKGAQTSNEKVDLFEDSPLGIDIYTGKPVNAMTIKYSKTGAHLIPTYYERGD